MVSCAVHERHRPFAAAAAVLRAALVGLLLACLSCVAATYAFSVTAVASTGRPYPPPLPGTGAPGLAPLPTRVAPTPAPAAAQQPASGPQHRSRTPGSTASGHSMPADSTPGATAPAGTVASSAPALRPPERSRPSRRAPPLGSRSAPDPSQINPALATVVLALGLVLFGGLGLATLRRRR